MQLIKLYLKRGVILKKGYFFTLDAFLALSVLVVGLIVILSSFYFSPSTSLTSKIGKDVLDFMAKNQIKDINNPYYGSSGYLVKNGTIKDTQKTLLQLLGQLYYYHDWNNSAYLISNITNNLILPQYSFEFFIEDYRVFPYNVTESFLEQKNKTKLLIPARRITFGRINNSLDLFGPYEVKILVWQS